ncbi:MAG: PEP-CTERM sorting domain-containing protein [Cyanothece sp. SIO2G6]|nr:PEP-CTERM sorting domain-containing protein [Cyanothece sp. SIO2G6]
MILRVDLLNGDYAAIDNLRIVASNTPGDVGEAIPEPTSIVALCILGMGLLVSRTKT